MQLTQIELEREMYDFGRGKAERVMAANEEAGRATNNPYAAAVYRRFVLPLAAAIEKDLTSKRPGRQKAHVVLMESMNSEAVALLTVRHALTTLMAAPEDKPVLARSLATVIGRAINHEKMLELFSEADPALFYTLVNDFAQRRSKSEEHRVNVFRLQAKRNGTPVPEWGVGGRLQVGSYLLNLLEDLGMVVTHTALETKGKGHTTVIEVALHPDIVALVSNIKGFVAATTPYYLPCVEKPKDWVSLSDGGFHTAAMRRLQPFAIKSEFLRSEEDVGDGDLTTVLAAMNAAQSTAWQINREMLDAIRLVAKHFDMDEILSQAEMPAPPKPMWLVNQKREDMTPDQQLEFAQWRRHKAQWFTEMKLRGTKFGRFHTALNVADKFSQFPAIYFVYFADFRGRLYAQTTGVSPQGSDMQKALLRFAEGKPLATPEAVKWFLIHGANKWGFDKASLEDRVKFIRDREDLILGFANDPIGNDDWREADSPLQFLAWCFEFRAWKQDPEGFLSHLPVGLDGTCNGLQNFSAMLRDEVGGAATNLTSSPLPKDIYQRVATETTALIEQWRPAPLAEGLGEEDKAKAVARMERELRFKRIWLEHGINRSLVKRSVMTLPYGSTRFSCADFIVADYLKMGKVKEFAKEEYAAAAQWLSHFVWEAIGKVVIKAREAMAWLQQAAKKIVDTHADPTIRWVSPSGFPVIQAYFERTEHRIRTLLAGNAVLRIGQETDRPDANRHKNGIAPNFVHSTDGAHEHFVAVAAKAEGINSLALIHDDFGTHAADTERFFHIIREQFVDMYERCDPIKEFAERFAIDNIPERGQLDIREVLKSTYFFS